VGLADIIFTAAMMGREKPLEIHGPPGSAAMTRHLLAAYPSLILRDRSKKWPSSNR